MYKDKQYLYEQFIVQRKSVSDSSVFLDFIYEGFDNFRFTDKYCRYARRVKI